MRDEPRVAARESLAARLAGHDAAPRARGARDRAPAGETGPAAHLLLSPDQFALTACAEAMAAVRARVSGGIGLAVLDRLPVERYEPEENRVLCWLLSQLLERPVAQAWNGTLLYDVRDTGKTLEYGVRRSVTNLDLTFHTDGPWLDLPPHLVGPLLHPPPRRRAA